MHVRALFGEHELFEAAASHRAPAASGLFTAHESGTLNETTMTMFYNCFVDVFWDAFVRASATTLKSSSETRLEAL